MRLLVSILTFQVNAFPYTHVNEGVFNVIFDISHVRYFGEVHELSPHCLFSGYKPLWKPVVKSHQVHHCVIPPPSVYDGTSVYREMGVGLFVELAYDTVPRGLEVIDSPTRRHPSFGVATFQQHHKPVAVDYIHTSVVDKRHVSQTRKLNIYFNFYMWDGL